MGLGRPYEDPVRAVDTRNHVERFSNRKFRLLTCALGRSVWHLLDDPRSLAAVEIGERFADGQATEAEREASWEAACAAAGWDSYPDSGPALACEPAFDAGWAAAYAVWPTDWMRDVISLMLDTSHFCSRLFSARDVETVAYHLIEKPRFECPPKEIWSLTVVHLAEAVYAGVNCAFALHDALLEDGQADLAIHFQEKHHPKGCWAVDLIRGKS